MVTAEGGPAYEMDASSGSISITGLTGQSFTYTGTTRTYIDTAGVMQDAAINTPRVEADGLLLEPEGANILLQSRNFDTSPWTNTAPGVTLTQNQTGIDGQSNKAWLIEDSTASQEMIMVQWPLSSSANSWTASAYVKKTSSASSFPGLYLSVTTGGTSQVAGVTINTDNGTLTDRTDFGDPPDAKGIESAGDFWFVWLSVIDSDDGNTVGKLYLVPVANADGSGVWAGAAQGSAVFDAVQLEVGNPYPSSYIDNDGVAAGSDLATDGDCSGGTLTTGAGWAHDAGNNEYDATASTANLDESNVVTAGKLYRVKTVWANITGGSVRVKCGAKSGQNIIADGTYYEYFVATNTTFYFDALSAFTGSLQSYEIVEFGTARASEAGALTYDLPSDLFAETLGSDLVTDGSFTGDGSAWTWGAGWSLDDGNDEADAVAGSNSYLMQFFSTNNGSLYRVAFTVRNYSAGTVTPEMGATAGSPVNANGAYKQYIVADSLGRVRFLKNSLFAGTIDDISVKEVTNAYDSGDGLAPPHGTALAWWRPGYDLADAGLLYLIHSSSGRILWHADGDIQSSDGSTTCSVALSYVKNTPYKLAAKWGYLSNNVAKFRVGYDSGSGVTWGAEQDFDGAFSVGANLEIADMIVSDPHHIKRIQIWKQHLPDEEIDATPAP